MNSRSHTHVRDHMRSKPKRLGPEQFVMCDRLLAEIKDRQDAEAERAVQANFGPIDLAEFGEEN